MLERHLETSYGLTPADYRAKWGVPANYPMVAPNYATNRSSLAKSIGLGRKNAETQIPPQTDAGDGAERNEGKGLGGTQLPSRRARGSQGLATPSRRIGA